MGCFYFIILIEMVFLSHSNKFTYHKTPKRPKISEYNEFTSVMSIYESIIQVIINNFDLSHMGTDGNKLKPLTSKEELYLNVQANIIYSFSILSADKKSPVFLVGDTSYKYAVKVTENHENSAFLDQKILKLNHPNIILTHQITYTDLKGNMIKGMNSDKPNDPLYGFADGISFLTSTPKKKLRWIFMEYLDIEIQENSFIHEKNFIEILYDILKGIYYIHRKKIAHCCLKLKYIRGVTQNNKTVYKIFNFDSIYAYNNDTVIQDAKNVDLSFSTTEKTNYRYFISDIKSFGATFYKLFKSTRNESVSLVESLPEEDFTCDIHKGCIRITCRTCSGKEQLCVKCLKCEVCKPCEFCPVCDTCKDCANCMLCVTCIRTRKNSARIRDSKKQEVQLENTHDKECKSINNKDTNTELATKNIEEFLLHCKAKKNHEITISCLLYEKPSLAIFKDFIKGDFFDPADFPDL